MGQAEEHFWAKATSKGLDLAKKSELPQEPNTLVFRVPAKFSITNIVKNEERKKGVDEYRVIMFKYQVQRDPIYEEYFRFWGNPFSKDNKGIWLLRYDNFDREWKYVASDSAIANEEFSTKNVEKALGK